MRRSEEFATLLAMRFAALVLCLCVVCGWVLAQEPPPAQASSAEADQAVEAVLKEFRRGLEGHSLGRARAVFDAERFPDYLAFEDQLGRFFASYDPIVVRYRVLEAQVSGDDGTALVEFQLEADPPERRSGMAVRRDQQVHLTLRRAGNKWKISDLRPRELFTP